MINKFLKLLKYILENTSFFYIKVKKEQKKQKKQKQKNLMLMYYTLRPLRFFF